MQGSGARLYITNTRCLYRISIKYAIRAQVQTESALDTLMSPPSSPVLSSISLALSTSFTNSLQFTLVGDVTSLSLAFFALAIQPEFNRVHTCFNVDLPSNKPYSVPACLAKPGNNPTQCGIGGWEVLLCKGRLGTWEISTESGRRGGDGGCRWEREERQCRPYVELDRTRKKECLWRSPY